MNRKDWEKKYMDLFVETSTNDSDLYIFLYKCKSFFTNIWLPMALKSFIVYKISDMLDKIIRKRAQDFHESTENYI
jgi:hypothetical protein